MFYGVISVYWLVILNGLVGGDVFLFVMLLVEMFNVKFIEVWVLFFVDWLNIEIIVLYYIV